MDAVTGLLDALPSQMRDPVLFAIPFFVLLLVLEWTAARRLHQLEQGERSPAGAYQRRDAWTSLSMGLVSVATTAAWKAGALLGYAAIFAYLAPWQLPADRWYTWLIALLGVDLLFYAYHRTAHRGRLIWACLTLVQNWIAGGRQPGRYDKASYSAWARTMGGILDAANIKGFLANENDMKARSSVSDDPVQQLVARLSEYEDGTVFVTGSVSKRHPAGTVSAKGILEVFHEHEEGDAKALRIPRWGYAPEDGRYTNPSRLGLGWKNDVASEPHRVSDLELSFEGIEHKASGSVLWKMHKKPSG